METQLEMCIRTIKSFGFEIPVDKVKYKDREFDWFKLTKIRNEIIFYKEFERFYCILRFFPDEDFIWLKIYNGGYGESDSIGPPLPDEKKLIDFINKNTVSMKRN